VDKNRGALEPSRLLQDQSLLPIPQYSPSYLQYRTVPIYSATAVQPRRRSHLPVGRITLLSPGGVYPLDWLVFLDLTHPTSLLPCGPDHLISLCSISFPSTYDDQYYHHDHHKATSILAASSQSLSVPEPRLQLYYLVFILYISTYVLAIHSGLRPTPL
jgi:hypothetical protein